MFLCVCLLVFARMFLLIVFVFVVGAACWCAFCLWCLFDRVVVSQRFEIPLSKVCWCWVVLFVCVLLLVFALMFLLIVFVWCWGCVLVLILSLAFGLLELRFPNLLKFHFEGLLVTALANSGNNKCPLASESTCSKKRTQFPPEQ